MKQHVTIIFLCLSISLFAQTEELYLKHFNVTKGIAIQGYDAVSYFTGKPQKGKDEFKIVYSGITYRFANRENLTAFRNTPEKYEPAYGGWCAYAMGETGEKVKVDPETYKIINNKLYLFYNFWTTNTLQSWNKNEKQLKEKGDRNWSSVFR